MIKSKVIISLLIIGLGVSFLGSCNSQNSTTKLNTQQSPAGDSKSQRAPEYTEKWDALNKALGEYEITANTFITQLTNANKDNSKTVDSKIAKQKLGEVDQKARDLQQEPSLTDKDKEAISEIIRLIGDINRNILDPAENGLTPGENGSIAIIQGKLGLKQDGNIGSRQDTDTKKRIKEALDSNLTLLEAEIQKLKPSNTPVVSASPAPENEELNKQIDTINKNITALQTGQTNQFKELKTLEKRLNQRRIGDIVSGAVGAFGLAALLGVGGYFLYQKQKNKKPQQSTILPLPEQSTILPLPESNPSNLSSQGGYKYSTLAQENEKIRQYINTLTDKVNNLSKQIYNHDDEISKLNRRTEQLSEPISSSSIGVSHSSQQPSQPGGNSVPQFLRNRAENEVQSPVQPSPEDELVTLWNSNPKALSQYDMAEVNETQDSMNARYAGSQNPPIVERVARNQGSFWVIKENYNRFYLVPKKTIIVNEFSLETISALFVHQGYYQDYKTITLRTPALVSAITGEQWKLEEPGELQFD